VIGANGAAGSGCEVAAVEWTLCAVLTRRCLLCTTSDGVASMTSKCADAPTLLSHVQLLIAANKITPPHSSRTA
jgi:hypothetical protein